ncbi:hypothetical protein C8P68_103210 [Mucilaginibacter yixingensis]|uniref:Lipoprotein n=1 Tax=Mucilaginibacter yixingensis TaxID=1295612 RepID=A0A2T5JB04_9SPHI|nr:hypothetical protein [Mucilaginibacter yixingensis]PTQ98051.1 hypothetical protein C8P68_103210 [Mucilaginibacter yixingensis]
MKRLTPLFLLGSLGLLFTACSHQPENPVRSIVIKHTELGRQTLFKITCDNFDQYFKDAPSLTIVSQKGIDSVTHILDKLTGTDDTGLDVRARIILTHADNKTDTACVGVSETRYKGAIYKTPEELLKLIEP